VWSCEQSDRQQATVTAARATRQASVATLDEVGDWVEFIPSHVPFAFKSKPNDIKIHSFLTKLQTKISWVLFMATVFYLNRLYVAYFQEID